MKTQIAKVMDEKRIKVADVRRALGVGDSLVSSWRTGKMYVPPKYRLPLANLLGVSPEDLFDESGIPKAVRTR